MPVERYRFYCTDGRDAVIDRVGKRIGNPLMIWGQAERIAREMMAGCNWRLD